MRLHSKAIWGAVGLSVAAAFAGPASASVAISDDASLASPNINAASPTNPSFYNGTSTPQGQFEVATDSATGIELGLTATFAFVGPVVPPPVGNTYIVPTGTSAAASGRAIWDYAFSIDLDPKGVGGLNFSSIVPGSGGATYGSTALLTITNDGTSQSTSYNPLTLLGDNESLASPNSGNTLNDRHKGTQPGDFGAQNSESPSFGFAQFGFNPWYGDSYTITLSIGGISDVIHVDAVPEPASMMIIGVGLAALGAVRRRRG